MIKHWNELSSYLDEYCELRKQQKHVPEAEARVGRFTTVRRCKRERNGSRRQANLERFFSESYLI